MKKVLKIAIDEFDIEDLSIDDKRLVEKAQDACKNAYAPYSCFNVGCALVLDDGTIIKGNNQENASYPCGCCAERTALFYAKATCPEKDISAIAMAAYNKGCFTEEALSPCGLCRQALLEAENRQLHPIRVIMYGVKKTIIVDNVASLLPLQFDSSNLSIYEDNSKTS